MALYLVFFCSQILINDVGFVGQANDTGEIITCKKCMKQINEIHLRYVDDLSLAEAVSLKELESVPVGLRPQPDAYHARTGHVLKPEDSRVYRHLLSTQQYATANGMQLNPTKTKLMLFNPAKVYDFMPAFPMHNEEIELIEKTKLLGVVLSSDMSWSPNTEYLVTRCNKKLWILRRLKKLGASQEDLIDVFIKQVRSLLEYAVPVWHPSLIGEDRLEIERIQKSAFCIILGDQYRSYSSSLKTLKMDTLYSRRNKLCKKFARKAAKNVKFSQWFKPSKKLPFTRRKHAKYQEVYSRTVRYQKSPISFLTNILNAMN